MDRHRKQPGEPEPRIQTTPHTPDDTDGRRDYQCFPQIISQKFWPTHATLAELSTDRSCPPFFGWDREPCHPPRHSAVSHSQPICGYPPGAASLRPGRQNPIQAFSVTTVTKTCYGDGVRVFVKPSTLYEVCCAVPLHFLLSGVGKKLRVLIARVSRFSKSHLNSKAH